MMYKALLVAVVLFAFIDLSLSQCGDIAPDNYKQWTWLLGSNLFNISVSSDSPGSRTKMSGVYVKGYGGFVFGGVGFSASGTLSLFNDVWILDEVSRQWRQVVPVASSSIPAARSQPFIWAVPDGVYIFGGFSDLDSTQVLSDMWYFDMKAFLWTAISQGSPSPSPRAEGSSWTSPDQKSLALFGGALAGNVVAADLWTFSVATRTWTRSSSSLPDNSASSVASSSWPGARRGSAAFVVNATWVVLFGGDGYGLSAGSRGILGDTWVLQLSTGSWSGFGELNVNVFSSTQPAPRCRAFYWYDEVEHLPYIFGGESYSKTSLPAILNDIWLFDLTSNVWKRQYSSLINQIGGAFINQMGVYGTQSVMSYCNIHPSRTSGVGFNFGRDSFTFGGRGVSNFTVSNLNGVGSDVWMYTWADPRAGYTTAGTTSAVTSPSSGGVNIVAIIVPIIILLLLLLALLLFLLWRRRRRHNMEGVYVVDQAGEFRGNKMFKANPNQSQYDFADLLDTDNRNNYANNRAVEPIPEPAPEAFDFL